MSARIPWNQIYAYLGAITTIVGLASFAQDLQAWQAFFQFIYSNFRLLDILGRILVTFGSGLVALVNLYQAIFYPIFQFIFSPLVYLFENIFHFSWNNRIYDIVFMTTSSFSAWYRGQIVKKSKLREAAKLMPEKPSLPKTEQLHYNGGLNGWLDSVWDKLQDRNKYEEKRQADEFTRSYNRDLWRYYREEHNYYDSVVSDINKVASDCNKAAMRSASITLSMLLFVWIVDILYVKFIDF